MLAKLSNLNDDDHFDVCVMGTGPAGLTIATTLGKSGKKIVLLEGGDFEYNEASQSLYRGIVKGDDYFALDEARLRLFGGSSNHWGGQCRMLDQIDFEAKGGLDITKWPIQKSDLDPFLADTLDILEIPPFPEDRMIEGSGLKQIHFEWSPPVNFGEKFQQSIISSGNIVLLLTANVLTIDTNGDAITGVNTTDYNGNSRAIHANDYVLATGGIENSRILLWSNVQNNNQIVSAPTTLGRYWMEHPHYVVGEAIVNADSVDETTDRFFSPTPSAMRKDQILNCGLRFRPLLPYKKKYKFVVDALCIAPDLANSLLQLVGKRLFCGGRLFAAWEQEPRHDNRIALSDERDRFGIPRVELHWRKSALDLKTVQRTAVRFGEYLGKSGTGRLRLEPWLRAEEPYPENDERGGNHHMGGTRMAESPAEGVVDRDCKVFGQDNLYVAGSSVFPSAGHANPTLTIVQLALRLAQHLEAKAS